MSATGTIRLSILVESELRMAGRALRALHAVDKTNLKEMVPAIQAALDACYAALYHIVLDKDDAAGIVVVSVPPPRVTFVSKNLAVTESPREDVIAQEREE